ncbi:hypothetical protein ACVWWO_003144 [Bradyrhizobium sp. F1.13.1]
MALRTCARPNGGATEDDGSWNDEIVAGQALVACEAARMLVYRVVDQRSRGLPPNAESSLARVAIVGADHAVANFGLDFPPEAFSGVVLPLLKPHHRSHPRQKPARARR